MENDRFLIDVILVNDNPNDWQMINQLITEQMNNISIHHLKNGDEALNFIFSEITNNDNKKQIEPKVILLDLNFSKRDGLDILKKIKEDEKSKTLPVAILSSSVNEEDALKAYLLGVNSFIQKPIVLDDYNKAIANLCYYWCNINTKPI